MHPIARLISNRRSFLRKPSAVANVGIALVSLVLPFLAVAESDIEEPIETEIELSTEYEILDFTETDDDGVQSDRRISLFTTDLDISRLFEIGDRGTSFVSLTASTEREDPDQGSAINREFIDLNELWLRRSFNSSRVQVGRFNQADETGWWWDEDLLGIGMTHRWNSATAQLTLAAPVDDWSTLNEDSDPEEKSIIRLLGSIHMPLSTASSIKPFFLHQSDQSSAYQVGQAVAEREFDEADDTITWIGARYQHEFSGNRRGDFSVSTDIAYMRGKSEQYVPEEVDDAIDGGDSDSNTIEEALNQSISGWAVNAWGRWAPPFSENSVISLGYAFGSGTKNNQPEGTRTFRQTGLHANETDNAYYGEITDPDLSNLHIASIHAIHAFGENRDVFVQFNHYRRVSVFDETLEWDLELEPEGEGKSIGTELAVGMQYEFDNGINSQLLFSRFAPGKAFSSEQREVINYYKISLSYEF